MSNSNIEIQGVTSLEFLLASTKVLEPHLKKNDKTMSWDGTIFVFNQQIAKKDFFGKVPVQVKSEKVTKLSIDYRSKNFSKIDLVNYFKDGGILIFLVEIDIKNNSKIFFASLLPNDLKIILDEFNLKKDKESKAIKLEYLSKENIGRLVSICKNFVTNRVKQMSIKHLPSIPSIETKELIISGFSDGRPIDQYLLNVDQYVYAKTDIEGLELFVKKVNIRKIRSKVKREVSINGEVFFTNYLKETSKNSERIIFGKEISFDKNSKKIEIKIFGNLEEQLLTNKFIVKLLKEKELIIEGGKIELQKIDNGPKLIKNLSERYSWLKDIESLLKIFSIENTKFNLDKITKLEEQSLKLLVDSLVYEKKITTNPFPEETGGKFRITIGNLVLGIIFYKGADGNYKIHNLFDRNLKLEFRVGNDKPNYQSSRYVGLKVYSLIKCDNLDVSTIIKDIKSIEYSEVYAEQVNFLVLEFIKAFDDTNSEKFIDTAEDIIDWLSLNDPKNEIFKLNKYQIIRRFRSLRKEEIEELMFMKNNADNEKLCGISILLENKTDVDFYLNKLSKESKEVFLDYPIYTLAEKLSLIES